MSFPGLRTALLHDALPFDNDETLLGSLVPFVREGLENDHRVVAALSVRNLGLMRDALGIDAHRVTMIRNDAWYRHPHETIAGWRRLLEEATAAGHPFMRIAGEVAFGDDTDTQTSWTRYEAALNRVFESSPCWIVCPYDLRLLPPEIVADARKTHPVLWEGPRREPSARFVEAPAFLMATPEPMPPIRGERLLDIMVPEEVAAIRALVGAAARDTGFPSDRVDDLLIVCSEVVTNALCHACSPRRFVMWRSEDGIVCEVSDAGPGMPDPVAGYRPPSGTPTGGMGLWIANRLADHVAVRSTPEGTTVRFAISG